MLFWGRGSFWCGGGREGNFEFKISDLKVKFKEFRISNLRFKI